MSAQSQPSYHCIPCLDGRHRTCTITISTDWDGVTSSTRCVCRRCARRHLSIVASAPAVARPLFTFIPLPAKAPQQHRRGRGRPVSAWPQSRIDEAVSLTAEGLSSRLVGERLGASAANVRQVLMKARKAAAAVVIGLVAFLVTWGSVAGGDLPPEQRPTYQRWGSSADGQAVAPVVAYGPSTGAVAGAVPDEALDCVQ